MVLAAPSVAGPRRGLVKVLGLADRAEANTRRMLEGLVGNLGYDDVTVVFEAPPSP